MTRGARICAFSDLPEAQGRGFYVEGRELVLVRIGAHVFAYENRCPHKGTSLDWAPSRFMSPDGAYLQCATHAALFRIDDGVCVFGPCLGERLSPCAALVFEGDVFLQK